MRRPAAAALVSVGGAAGGGGAGGVVDIDIGQTAVTTITTTGDMSTGVLLQSVGGGGGNGGLTEAARSPIHATGVGLCKYAVETAAQISTKKGIIGDDNFKKIYDKMKGWVKDFF